MTIEYLPVTQGHELAYRCVGAPNKPAIIFLHGGPGSSSQIAHEELFPLAQCFLIQWDQRGCGHSRAIEALRGNTTQALIQDMERIREHLNIQKWMIYGGSWGATLALEYAKQHPERVLRLFLRGSFLARRVDLQWFIGKQGLASRFPAAYAVLQRQIAPRMGEHLLFALLHLLQEPSLSLVQRYYYAQLWGRWERLAMDMQVDFHAAMEADVEPDVMQQAIQQLSIYCHYAVHEYFMSDPEQGVLHQLDRIRHIPALALHGEEDRVCPPHLVKELADSWPELDWCLLPGVGHGLNDSGMQQALKQAFLSM